MGDDNWIRNVRYNGRALTDLEVELWREWEKNIYPRRRERPLSFFSALKILHVVMRNIQHHEGDKAMSSLPENMPDPTGDYHEFVIGLMKCKDITNLGHYRTAAGPKQARLWTIAVAMQIAECLEDEVVEVGLITIENDEKVNFYKPTDGAREFWKNGLEEGLTPKQILDGWKAMMSITKDGKVDE